MDNFDKYSNYNEASSFTQIQFGHDKGLLETELNELQQIQENQRTEIIRKIVHSGFNEPVQSNFTGIPFIYNPTENGLVLTNKIAIAPFKAIVNGYEINAQGNFEYNQIPNYILIDLGPTEEESTKDTLVYLEVWFEIVHGDSSVEEYGYYKGNLIDTPAQDERIGVETSRRIRLCWDIRVKNQCDFNKYPEGFGYIDTLHYSNIQATAAGQFGTQISVNKVFAPATFEFFSNENFYEDPNLYVGGRPDYELNTSTLYGQYSFALPMFRIRRRNSTPYSLTNYNGSSSNNAMYVVNKSRIKGDLLAGFRPDGYAYDVIQKSDVIDLRKTISFSGFDTLSLTDKTVKDLFNNELQTYATKKMRRVQFGNPCYLETIDFNNLDELDSEDAEDKRSLLNAVRLYVPFNKSTLPVYPKQDSASPMTSEVQVPYEDSISGTGAVIKGSTELKYRIRGGAKYKFYSTSQIDNEKLIVGPDKGTIDFYFKPFWNGANDNENQIILSLVNNSDSYALRLRKEGNKLLFETQNYDLDNLTATDSKTVQELRNELEDKYSVNQVVIDLSTDLLRANTYYHIRLSWINDPFPLNGQMFVYINGNLIGQENYPQCDSSILPYYLKIGDVRNTSEKGFLIDNLIVYKNKFEQLQNYNNLYSYTINKFWPTIPKDFTQSDTLLMPSFNSVVNNYGDIGFDQEDTVIQVPCQDITANTKLYTITLNDDKIIKRIVNTYDLDGNELIGVWRVNKNTATFTLSNTYNDIDVTTLKYIIVQCIISLSAGCGGQDLPTDILAAALIEYDKETTNYQYNLNLTKELSFHAYNDPIPRQVKILKPQKVADTEDSAYDFCNSLRKQDQCYARLIYYNASVAKAVNFIEVPMQVYGYDIIGIVGCNNKRIKKVVKIPDNTNYGELDLNYMVYFDNPLLVGETLTLYLACAGFSFDYELNSKTLIKNIHQCKLVSFVGNGNDTTYTVPCCTIKEEGTVHGGVLKSVFTFQNNLIDDNGNITLDKKETVAYEDSELFFNENGTINESKRVFNTMPVKIQSDCFGTPFIKVVFDDYNKPAKNTVIQIPVVITYQFTQDTILSLWYQYIPYQGILTSKEQRLTRLSNWQTFITTLSTGKDMNQTIKQNIVNCLPGGRVAGYKVDNKSILLTSIFDKIGVDNSLDRHFNKQLVFTTDFLLNEDEDICNLETIIDIKKDSSYSQDGYITINNININEYLIDCQNPITKYIGSFCLVKTSDGELCVLLIGNIDTEATTLNWLKPLYGDLFRISGRPCLHV